MNYLENNLSVVIIITRVYVTMTEFHENMRTLDDIQFFLYICRVQGFYNNTQ